ncbi:Gfo/Idh/MocA family protein [Alkalicoccus chagannorensis]|uniref:Gfo/Idh/MocA family protein n=1 Tax=Alkalicoccus chagannorensis TaxID=427072 RepID=UPI000421454C|nr:Gfo/Idh/MocA family oxidoreductase [Alkalicoccus chagannorensis]
MIKTALLGAWHVHTDGFVQAFTEAGGTITAVWDEHETRGREAAARYHASFEPDLPRILAQPDIEAVLVESSTTSHEEVITAAAQAGKAIFTDKALTPDLASSRRTADAVRAAGIPFMISLEAKSSALYQWVFDRIHRGELGQVTSAFFRRSHQAAVEPMLPSYWFDTSQTGGGITLDLGCHGLYLLPWLIGERPDRVQASMRAPFDTGADEISSTTMTFPGGAIASAHTSSAASQLDNTLEIVGTHASVQILGSRTEDAWIRFATPSGIERIDPSSWTDAPLPSAVFADVLERRKPVPEAYSLQEALYLSEMIEAAYTSAEENRTVYTGRD